MHINAIQISDSIVIWTEEKTLRSYYDLIIIVRELLGHGMNSGLPLRACIDFGEFGNYSRKFSDSINTQTFFGKAITNSYKKSESQSWAGGFITKNALESYKTIWEKETDEYICQLTSLETLITKQLLKKFKVPFLEKKLDGRNEFTSEEYCINWVSWQRPKKSKANILKSFESFNKKIDNKRVAKIISNTINFWEAC